MDREIIWIHAAGDNDPTHADVPVLHSPRPVAVGSLFSVDEWFWIDGKGCSQSFRSRGQEIPFFPLSLPCLSRFSCSLIPCISSSLHKGTKETVFLFFS